MLTILQLGAGKHVIPDDYDWGEDELLIVNVDSSYSDEESQNIHSIETYHYKVPHEDEEGGQIFLSNMDVFDFLSKYKFTFDYIIMNRFLEHIGKFDLQHFLYLLSTVCIKGTKLSIVVPNYLSLAYRIIKEEKLLADEFPKDWENIDTVTTTEIVNTPDMPHASIWTPQRATHYLQLEKRFNIKEIEDRFIFDGRDIYMKILAERI